MGDLARAERKYDVTYWCSEMEVDESSSLEKFARAGCRFGRKGTLYKKNKKKILRSVTRVHARENAVSALSPRRGIDCYSSIKSGTPLVS